MTGTGTIGDTGVDIQTGIVGMVDREGEILTAGLSLESLKGPRQTRTERREKYTKGMMTEVIVMEEIPTMAHRALGDLVCNVQSQI